MAINSSPAVVVLCGRTMKDLDKIKELKLTCPFCGKEMKNTRVTGILEKLSDGEWCDNYYQYGYFSCECGVKAELYTTAYCNTYTVDFIKRQTIEIKK